jgi:hypothetical protein
LFIRSLIRKSLILVFAFFLSASASTQVTAQTTNGTVHLSASSPYGGSDITLRYRYPPSVATGSNLVIVLTFHMDNVSGYTSYLWTLKLDVTVYIDLAHVLVGTVKSDPSKFLYPGGTWGPINVTIPITEANSGVGAGQTRNANISIALADVAWLGRPLNYDLPQKYQASGGYVSIYSPSVSPPSLEAIVLLAGGIVIVAVAILVPRLRQPQH